MSAEGNSAVGEHGVSKRVKASNRKVVAAPKSPKSPKGASAKPESRLAMVRRARKINRELAEVFPYAHPELDFRNPFELLVATVLSAQTTDLRVNQTTPALFAKYPTPEDLAAAVPEEVEELIRPTGFFRAKTKSIMGLAAALRDDFGGEVPGRLEDLVKLPGVGRKTAFVVLGNAFGVPGITVDTHFMRLVRRWKWTEQEDPVKIEAEIAEIFPKSEWTMLSHRVIFHGRRICHARKPACGACPIAPSAPRTARARRTRRRPGSCSSTRWAASPASGSTRRPATRAAPRRRWARAAETTADRPLGRSAAQQGNEPVHRSRCETRGAYDAH